MFELRFVVPDGRQLENRLRVLSFALGQAVLKVNAKLRGCRGAATQIHLRAEEQVGSSLNSGPVVLRVIGDPGEMDALEMTFAPTTSVHS